MQIPEIPAQRKFVLEMWHAHSNAYKPPKSCGAHKFHAKYKILTEMYWFKCIGGR